MGLVNGLRVAAVASHGFGAGKTKMKIKSLKIRNFRSVRSLDLHLGETTVLIGQNNAGKTAILDALRIALTRRWGQRGTGFTENDVHKPDEKGNPRTLPPVEIQLRMEEDAVGEWDADMVAALDDIIAMAPDGRNALTLRVTCAWSEEKEAFEPKWDFLDFVGNPLTGKATRATNLTGFFGYLPLFWLGALRDAADEFTPRSGYWGRLLRDVKIPEELEDEALRVLGELDAKIIAADPKLAAIAELIGKSTQVAVGEGPGSARLNTLPLAMEEMLQRTGIVLRNEQLRPWLPLGSHGQGLQSLAVIFLFQAAVLQQLAADEKPGMSPVFAIEEPEAHLHPQAARALWGRVKELSGQKILTTHSPYFVHQVPLRELRLVRIRSGCTECSFIPDRIVSKLPWNPAVDSLMKGEVASEIFVKDFATGNVAAVRWFDKDMEAALSKCYDAGKAQQVKDFRTSCRILPSQEDEAELAFHGRRVRGEIFFARRWILVEGVCEYLLLNAVAKALDWPLDTHGVAVIDFQLCGSPGIYAALAEAFGIPWDMITDADGESQKFRTQLLARGFSEESLKDRLVTLDGSNNLEEQLIADGHEAVLREALFEAGHSDAKTLALNDLKKKLRKRKTDYMRELVAKVSADGELAEKMPKPFVALIKNLKGA